MLKKIKIYGAILILLVITFFIINRLSNDDVGNISLGMFTLKDIKLNTMIDPVVTGVTCHVASIEASFSLSDPSDSSISCRQTGNITAEMIAQIDKSKSGEVIFKKSKSIFFKTMKIRRIFDAKNQTLMYLSYATKETSGSFKHSLSTVPLWGTKAYIEPVVNIKH
ncbi:CreA family protein [Colwellia sp. TT2012]|uniref:CreA family protein n=1 Tax=Colwellia sp. TT2012 TaxID=1720342 RepID=UPI00070EACA8|nr:CreA family protein [Colwellia sp. TT2012]